MSSLRIEERSRDDVDGRQTVSGPRVLNFNLRAVPIVVLEPLLHLEPDRGALLAPPIIILQRQEGRPEWRQSLSLWEAPNSVVS